MSHYFRYPSFGIDKFKSQLGTLYPDNYENDLANLYFKYFIKNKEYEKYFIDGYKSYMNIKEDFYKNIKYFLIAMVIDHCSWSFVKANDYYTENIEFLKKVTLNL